MDQTNPAEVSADVVAATRRWVDSVVIGLSFCPFAAAVVSASEGLEIVVASGDARSRLEQLLAALVRLQHSKTPETVLIVMPTGVEDFSDFLDLMELAEGVVEVHGFEGEFQLAGFHPEYCFAGTDSDDASNYTNRSPYPTVHILREDSVTSRLETFDNPEEIPNRNIARTRELGLTKMYQFWESCFHARK